MIKGFLKGLGKWLIIVPAIAIFAMLMIGLSNKNDTVTGYQKVGSTASWSLGVATFSLPTFVSDFLDGKVYVQGDRQGVNTVDPSDQAKASQLAIEQEKAKRIAAEKKAKKLERQLANN